MNGKTLKEVYNYICKKLKKVTDEYNKIALIFLAQLLNEEKALIIANKENIQLTDQQIDQLLKWVDKYVNGYPLQYCTNIAYFMGLQFYVDSNVLIPRFDTEIVVEQALKLLVKSKKSYVLEIGTGSGCISVSIAKYIDNVNIIATDISNEALKVAKQNAIINGVENKITFINSDLFKNVDYENFDMIISNPPYISEQEYELLDKKVKMEPKTALVSNDNGLYFFNKIAKEGFRYLKNGGYIVFEVGFSQGKEVKNILLYNNYVNIVGIYDLNKIERCIIGQKISLR